MSDEKRRHISGVYGEILNALKHNHRKKLTFRNETGTYGRTIAEGEAAFHAIDAISQLPSVKYSDEENVEIPRWVFDALLATWNKFLLFGSLPTKKRRKTLGQVVGCEPNYKGGREGATASIITSDELLIVGSARHFKKESARLGIKLSKEESALEIASQLEELESGFPRKSADTIERYLKKYPEVPE